MTYTLRLILMLLLPFSISLNAQDFEGNAIPEVVSSEIGENEIELKV